MTNELDRPSVMAAEPGCEYAVDLIRRIVAECPQRRPTSSDERRAQEILADELAERGCLTRLLPFRFGRNLYAVLLLHFGLAVVGCGLYFVYPLAAAALHLLVGISFVGDTAFRPILLRRLLPWGDSQNLVATLPSRGERQRRLVFMAHADAALTGWIFDPRITGAADFPFPRPFGILRKQMLLAAFGFALLVFLDLAWAFAGQQMWLLYACLIVGCAWGALVNLQIVWRNEVVAGASDNLSGCAALPVLLDRLADERPDDVELVFVAVGCEEAGCGGAWNLAKQMREEWSPDETAIINLDILTNGQLRLNREFEVLPLPTTPWLERACWETAQREPRFAELELFDAPAGKDDSSAFIAAGYDAVCIASAEPKHGTSRHYHLPSDTPENLDLPQYELALDYVTELARRVMQLPAWRVAEEEPRATTFAAGLLAPRWLATGAASGIAAGALIACGFNYAVAFSAFRATWFVIVVAVMPLFLLLACFGKDPNRHPLGRHFVTLLLAALAITFWTQALYPLVFYVAGTQPTALIYITGVIAGVISGSVLGGVWYGLDCPRGLALHRDKSVP